MAINKAMRTLLGAITAFELDVNKSYKFERKLEKIFARMHGSPSDYKIWDQKILSGDYPVPVRIFAPPKTESAKMILFFHGGGWVTGGIENYTGLCLDLAKATGNMVACVDYRLAPEHKFPAAPKDCYAVAREFYAGNVLQIAPENITLMGDSAGGNLAAAVSLMARDRGEFLPKRQILLYPATYYDHTVTSPFPSVKDNGTDYLLTAKRIQNVIGLYKSSDEDLKNPYFAPLMAQNFSNQPDTLIITAEYCPLRDEGACYGGKLAHAGNLVKVLCIQDAMHAFLMLPPSFPHVKQAHNAINDFLNKG